MEPREAGGRERGEAARGEGMNSAPQLHIAPVVAQRDFERCVAVQHAVCGYSEGDLVPKRVFIVA